MLKKALIALLLALILCGSIGCTIKHEEDMQDYIDIGWYNLAALKANSKEQSRWDKNKIICSKLSLDIFKASYDVEDYVQTYDKAFFKDKALIICLFTKSSGGFDISIESIKISNKNVRIAFDCIRKTGVNFVDTKMYWVCIIEAKKEDLSSDMGINVEFVDGEEN